MKEGFSRNRLVFRRPRRAGLPVLFFALVSVPSSFAGGSGSFALDLSTEAVIGIPGAALFTAGHFLTDGPSSARSPFGWFDEDWTFPYDSSLDTMGTIASLASVAALPLLLDSFGLQDISTVAVMYAESSLWTIGIKNVLKASFGRPRPYLSYAGTPESVLPDGEGYYSFPSGHTAFAFMTASFITYVYSQGDSTKTQKILVGVGAFAIAGGTAALRVLSGSHYPTDAAAGALIGAATGVLIPWLHKKLPKGWALGAGFGSMSISISY